MKRASLLLMVVAACLATSESAEAQFRVRKPQLGVFGGATLPRGTFGEDVELGWNAGALFKVRLTRTLDARIDGTYVKFGTTDIEFDNATVESNSDLLYGTLVGELNLGADSAAYPGDNSVSPYINAGLGMYRLKFDGSCTDAPAAPGSCTGFIDTNEDTNIGITVGAGANVPLSGIPAFAEFRYHRFGTVFPINQSGGNRQAATMFTVSVGIKIR
jgi:opacity protein-like surface antigen